MKIRLYRDHVAGDYYVPLSGNKPNEQGVLISPEGHVEIISLDAYIRIVSGEHPTELTVDKRTYFNLEKAVISDNKEEIDKNIQKMHNYHEKKQSSND